MFQTVLLSIISSFSLYTQQWYMSHRFADSLRAGSCKKLVYLVGFIIGSYKLYTTVKSKYTCRMRCFGLPVVLFSSFSDGMTPVVISFINIFLT